MAGRPSRQASNDLCARLERVRADAGVSQAALADVLLTSPSNLSRSMKARGFSRDMALRVETLIERGPADLRNRAATARGLDDGHLQRALILLHQLSKMVPDLERALVATRRAANAEETP